MSVVQSIKPTTNVGRTVAIISACLMILASILYILSNALPIWGLTHSESFNGTFGLWQQCTLEANRIHCERLPLTCIGVEATPRAVCAKRIATRIFLTLACVLSAVSALCLFACLVVKTKLHVIMVLVGKILPFASLVVGVIAVALGIAYAMYSGSLRLGDAAVLGITAVAVNIFAALVALMIR